MSTWRVGCQAAAVLKHPGLLRQDRLAQVTLLKVKIVHGVRTYVQFLMICSTTFMRSRYLRLASAKESSSWPDLASSHHTEFPLHRLWPNTARCQRTYVASIGKIYGFSNLAA